VIVTEMRGHGETGRRHANVPFSLTVMEGKDILEVAQFAKKNYKTKYIFQGLIVHNNYSLLLLLYHYIYTNAQ
jgi:hypothetical protein